MTLNSKSLQKSRGKNTQVHLLEAGIKAFAQFGPDGISTRKLAQLAHVNIAAITYYFGGKEGYYLAVVQYLIRDKVRPFFEFVDKIEQKLAYSEMSTEKARDLLQELMYTFTRHILMNPDAQYIASISSREHLHPTPAYEIIYEHAVSRIHGLFSRLIARATGASENDEKVILQTHALLGQTILFRIAATSLLRRLGWEEYTEERAEHIARLIAEMGCRALGLYESLEKTVEKQT